MRTGLIAPALALSALPVALMADDALRPAETLDGLRRDGTPFLAVRPVGGRWWWPQVAPGIFAPEAAHLDAPLAPGQRDPATADLTPEERAALARLAALPRPAGATDGAWWCLDVTTAEGQARLACQED